ncbi:MAG: hypothetical protein FD161_1484 [Limisphaerales bacterium]|nr:MAG: hypothetical protein FD161_1484 [Limisphaerales bacterium]KAG0509561.1 MAG: hypothetical protein E1N63_1403 [Limisphaerales bacterium]TXT52397.1 MAG: hypothetical protein FD140_884 [Limisphaerales bacterium]
MSIALIDTSVFCNLLKVPGRDQHCEEMLSELTQLIEQRTTLLLPMTAVIETGNHIAKVSDGGRRRTAALRFCSEVGKAIDGTAPWTATPFWEVVALRNWLDEFPDQAMRGVGMGDLSIIKEWERQCDLHKARRVFIWSLDGTDLGGYDRKP